MSLGCFVDCLGEPHQDLGGVVFERAYECIKQHQEQQEQEHMEVLETGGEGFDGVAFEQDRIEAELAGILGRDRAHYSQLIDQLIFMEDSTFG